MSKRLTFVLMLFMCLCSFSVFAEDEAKPDPNKPIYYQINEPFTINFYTQSKKKYRYLQVKIALMSHDQKILDSAKQNLPMLEDALRSLLMDQTLETVSSVTGREKIQQVILTKFNKILKNETGKDDIKAVYFTSFILQ